MQSSAGPDCHRDGIYIKDKVDAIASSYRCRGITGGLSSQPALTEQSRALSSLSVF